MSRLWCIWIFGLFSGGFSFNLPGFEPVNYCADPARSSLPCKSSVKLYVNRLNSQTTLIPYEYHHFDFCPTDEANSPVENLGQIVFGDRIRPGPYKIDFLEDTNCKVACTRQYMAGNPDSEKRLSTLWEGIRLNYQHNWIVDNLPVAFCYEMEEPQKSFCSFSGFPMGFHSESPEYSYLMNGKYNSTGFYYLFNHVDFTITYQTIASDWRPESDIDVVDRIISVKVQPKSINHRQPHNLDCQGNNEPFAVPITPLNRDTTLNIVYTYSVRFVQNDFGKWSSRWDYIMNSSPHTDIHCYSILSSLVVVLFLSGMVALIMLYTMRKDVERYNEMNAQQEVVGWISLHGDVFRPPRYARLLAVFVGSGAQVLATALVTLVLACFGLLSPANRGGLMSCAIFSYILLGTLAGYISTRIYTSFDGGKCMKSILMTSMLCPGIVFGLYCVMNVILWSYKSSGAIPVGELFTLLAFWLCGLVPLTFLGAFFGYRKPILRSPVHTNEIRRTIPSRSICMHPFLGIIMGGVLPFTCIFIQLFFILNSIWYGQMNDMFIYQFLLLLILVITCSESTILLCYSHLRLEDYRWWWRSFLASGFTAVYFFGYCGYYFVVKLSIADVASTILYFGYTAIMVFLFFLMTGAIGFLACFWFMRSMYSYVENVGKISAIYK